MVPVRNLCSLLWWHCVNATRPDRYARNYRELPCLNLHGEESQKLGPLQTSMKLQKSGTGRDFGWDTSTCSVKQHVSKCACSAGRHGSIAQPGVMTRLRTGDFQPSMKFFCPFLWLQECLGLAFVSVPTTDSHWAFICLHAGAYTSLYIQSNLM